MSRLHACNPQPEYKHTEEGDQTWQSWLGSMLNFVHEAATVLSKHNYWMQSYSCA